MAFIVADRVKETSTSTGTGAFTLSGAVTGFTTFSAAKITYPFTKTMGVGDTFCYAIVAVDENGAPTGEWEVGDGTYSAVNTLTRSRVTSNSAGTTTQLSFSAGTKEVMLVVPADQVRYNKLAPYTSGLSIYVNQSTGSATNDGLSPSRPVQYISQAMTRLAAYAWHIKSHHGLYADLYLADGVYNAAVNVPDDVVLSIYPTTGSASTVTIGPSSGNAINVGRNAEVIVSGVTLTAVSGSAISVEQGGVCEVYNDVVFGECGEAHVTSYGEAIIYGVTIAGDAPYFASAKYGGRITLAENEDITLSGTRAFTAFAEAKFCGIVESLCTFTGTASGLQYEVSRNAVVQAMNDLPGTSGTALYGGVYAV